MGGVVGDDPAPLAQHDEILYRLALQHLHPSDVGAWWSLGYHDPDVVHALITAGVTPGLARILHDDGVRDPAQMRHVARQVAEPRQIGDYTKVGVTSLDRIERLNETGVTPRDIEAFRAAGVVDDAVMVSLTRFGISGDVAWWFARRGVNNPAEMVTRWRSGERPATHRYPNDTPEASADNAASTCSEPT